VHKSLNISLLRQLFRRSNTLTAWWQLSHNNHQSGPAPVSTTHLTHQNPDMAAEERLLVPIEVFSDTLCPWCWVEKRSIEAAMRRYQAKHPDVDFELVWRSYCLNPLLKTSDSSLPPLLLCTP